MRLHSGEHPRLGATDVLPFVPIEGVSLDDCAALPTRPVNVSQMNFDPGLLLRTRSETH